MTLLGAGLGAFVASLCKKRLPLGLQLLAGTMVFAASVTGLAVAPVDWLRFLSLIGGGFGFGFLAAVARAAVVLLDAEAPVGSKFGVYAAVSRTSAIFGPLLWAGVLALLSGTEPGLARQVAMGVFSRCSLGGGWRCRVFALGRCKSDRQHMSDEAIIVLEIDTSKETPCVSSRVKRFQDEILNNLEPFVQPYADYCAKYCGLELETAKARIRAHLHADPKEALPWWTAMTIRVIGLIHDNSKVKVSFEQRQGIYLCHVYKEEEDSKFLLTSPILAAVRDRMSRWERCKTTLGTILPRRRSSISSSCADTRSYSI